MDKVAEVIAEVKIAVEAEVVRVEVTVNKVKVKLTLVTKDIVILMGLQFNPVFGTGFSENPHIFVKSQGPVLGRTSGYLNPINEILASSSEEVTIFSTTKKRLKFTKKFMTCFTVKMKRK